MRARLPLARAEHDPVAVRRSDQRWLDAAWTRARVLVVAPDLTVAVERAGDAGPTLVLHASSEVPAARLRIFLGEYDGAPYFAVLAADDAAVEQPRQGLRELGAAVSGLDAGLLTAAVALTNWHRTHPRCPRCGAETTVERAGWVRRCVADDSEHFPRTDPAVIMLVHDGADRCLLGRQPSWPPGRFSILAGFVEPGESLEAAVAREVAEEAGLRVTDIRYVDSQPWPFPASLMVGFTARLAGDDRIRRTDDELAEARWFSRDELRVAGGLPGLPSPVSIARRIVDDWLRGALP